MGALLVKLLAEGVELALLRRQISSRRTRRLCFQGAMHALVSAVLLGFARLDSGKTPSRTHQADSWDNLPRVLVAKGTPLSVR